MFYKIKCFLCKLILGKDFHISEEQINSFRKRIALIEKHNGKFIVPKGKRMPKAIFKNSDDENAYFSELKNIAINRKIN